MYSEIEMKFYNFHDFRIVKSSNKYFIQKEFNLDDLNKPSIKKDYLDPNAWYTLSYFSPHAIANTFKDYCIFKSKKDIINFWKNSDTDNVCRMYANDKEYNPLNDIEIVCSKDELFVEYPEALI